MELEGKVKFVGELISVSPTFIKRELVVTTNEQYPQHILIEFVQDKVDSLENLAIGTLVKVGINIGGKEWVNPKGETKYFNSIKGWKLERLDSQENAAQYEAKPLQNSTPNAPTSDFNEEDHSDLPF
jgi:hypothetical protein